METAVGEIWQSVLRCNTIGLDDDFFLLGGDSLQANHLIDDIHQRFDVDIPFVAMFADGSTIAKMARLIEERQMDGSSRVRPRPSPISRDVPLPASFTQQSFWVGSLLFRNQPVYNVSMALRLRGPLDLETLNRSLTSLVERHETLRIRFLFEGGRLLQVPFAPEPTALEILDARELAGDDEEARVALWAQREAQRPLDIVEGPSWRIALLRLGEDDHVLLAVLHHAIIDGWGLAILSDDLFAAYAEHKDGGAPSLPSLNLQCGDFAAWQRRCADDGGFEAELAYWRDKLAGSPPVLRLPADRPRPKAPDWRGRKATMTLPPVQAAALRDFGRTRHATLFMTLLAAFEALLHAHTGKTDIVVGVPSANRPTRDFDQVAGCFANAMPYRTDLDGDPTFEEVLERIRGTASEAYDYQQIPIEMLIKDLVPIRGIGQNPFFSIVFQLRNYRGRSRKHSGGLEIAPFEFDPGLTQLELTIEWEDRNDGLVCGFTYRTELFDDATVAGWMKDYQSILETVVTDPKTKLSRF